VHAATPCVDVGHGQGKPFAQAQPQAVEREEDPVAQDAGGAEQALRLIDGDDRSSMR